MCSADGRTANKKLEESYCLLFCLGYKGQTKRPSVVIRLRTLKKNNHGDKVKSIVNHQGQTITN